MCLRRRGGWKGWWIFVEAIFTQSVLLYDLFLFPIVAIVVVVPSGRRRRLNGRRAVHGLMFHQTLEYTVFSRKEVIVRADFSYTTAIKAGHKVCRPDSRDTMSNGENCSSLHQMVQSILHKGLGFSICKATSPSIRFSRNNVHHEYTRTYPKHWLLHPISTQKDSSIKHGQ